MDIRPHFLYNLGQEAGISLPGVREILEVLDQFSLYSTLVLLRSYRYFWYIEFTCPQAPFSILVVVPRHFCPVHNVGGFDEPYPCNGSVPAGRIRIFPEWMRLDSKPDSWRHGAQHHSAACQCHSHDWTACDFFRGCERGFAVELPVAKKQHEYQRSHGEQLHDAGYDQRGQRREI
jgi:hypothetical protein